MQAVPYYESPLPRWCPVAALLALSRADNMAWIVLRETPSNNAARHAKRRLLGVLRGMRLATSYELRAVGSKLYARCV